MHRPCGDMAPEGGESCLEGLGTATRQEGRRLHLPLPPSPFPEGPLPALQPPPSTLEGPVQAPLPAVSPDASSRTSSGYSG